jgi:lysyl-tRNA synthetase class 2
VTDWAPAAGDRARRARARLYRDIRHFLDERDVLEVETPTLASHGVTDPNIECMPVSGAGFLQSSPEYHMKRLLAAGAGPIYQIARVFRAGEQGRRHNPEFTLLEWYRPGFALTELVDECLRLLEGLLDTNGREHWRYRQLFQQELGLDPLTADTAELAECAGQGDAAPPVSERQPLLDWLLASRIQPALPRDRLVVIRDFPPAAAALARIEADPEDAAPVAQRFEVFFGGHELANGYHELVDPQEQAQRFEQDRQIRAQRGQPDRHPDPFLLHALEAGLPDCSGVALGLERVLMCQLGVADIAEVLNFPFERA